MCLCLRFTVRGRGKFHYRQLYNFKPAGSWVVKISAIMTIAARVTLGIPPPAYAARYAMVMQPPRLMTNTQTGSMSISKSIVIKKGLDDAGAVGGIFTCR